MEPVEIWKPIARYNGDYSVSCFGRVRSIKGKETKILSACKTKEGYLAVCLSYLGKTRLERIHRLVAEAFIHNPTPSQHRHVRHISSDREDNRVENLQWTGHRNQQESYPAIGDNPGYDQLRRYREALRGKEPSTFTNAEIASIKYYWNQGWGIDSLILCFGGTATEVRRIAYNHDYKEIEPAAW